MPLDRLTAVPPAGAAVIRDAVATFEAAFPGRVGASYVEGSWADGTMVETSDLDLVVIFRGERSASERQQSAALRAACQQRSPLELDLTILDETALARGVSPQLKLGAHLVYGDDLCRNLPLIPMPAWTRDRMHTSYWRTVTLFERPVPVRLPVDYPDPTDAFYGYLRRPTRLPDGTTMPGTRDLVRSVGWMATALIALRAGQYVVRKQDCPGQYRMSIGDQWTALIGDVATLCRTTWRYQIPNTAHDRARLRSLCEQTLAFENAFLTTYRAFVIDQLQGGPPADRAHARWVLERLPWTDPAIEAALRPSHT